ncbi:hypothetical protein [Nocardioides convexus]|uniref:hypothetical protein n=1 Tax=Nocardioides convexus TaxID=2712224 RepID=UPI002418B3C3|nr:hypothetical protein [Nocardioides convexus]
MRTTRRWSPTRAARRASTSRARRERGARQQGAAVLRALVPLGDGPCRGGRAVRDPGAAPGPGRRPHPRPRHGQRLLRAALPARRHRAW